MSETPETDMFITAGGYVRTEHQWRTFARRLERERDKAREAHKQAAIGPWRKANEGKWWCQYCLSVVDPVNVTYEQTHDPRYGGCGGCVHIISNAEVSDAKRSLD